MFCHKCGNCGTDNYCEKCGTRLEEQRIIRENISDEERIIIQEKISKKRGIYWGIGVIFFIIISIFVVLFLYK